MEGGVREEAKGDGEGGRGAVECSEMEEWAECAWSAAGRRWTAHW